MYIRSSPTQGVRYRVQHATTLSYLPIISELGGRTTHPHCHTICMYTEQTITSTQKVPLLTVHAYTYICMRSNTHTTKITSIVASLVSSLEADGSVSATFCTMSMRTICNSTHKQCTYITSILLFFSTPMRQSCIQDLGLGGGGGGAK